MDRFRVLIIIIVTYCSGERNNRDTASTQKTSSCKQMTDSTRIKTAVCQGANHSLPLEYDVEKSICCNGLFNRTSPNEECCRGDIFDNREYFCCGNHTFKYTSFTGCCGKQTYTGVDKMCCNDVLTTKVDNQTECCGRVTFNPAHYICCNNKSILKESGNSMCCGNQMYDERSQTCCNGNVQSSYGQRNKKGICYGKRNYAKECYSCKMKDNKPVVNKMFNLTNQICCDGKIQHRQDNLTLCCGNTIVNAETFECRNGTEVRKTTSVFLTNTTTSSTEAVYTEKQMKQYQTPSNQTDLPIGIATATAIGAVFVIALSFFSVGYCIKRIKKGDNHSLNNEQERFLRHSDNEHSSLVVRGELEQKKRSESHSDRMDTVSKYSKGNCSVSNFSISLQRWDCFEEEFNEKVLKDIAAIDLNKSMSHDGNLISHVLVDRCTQTGPKKECNKRTIFGHAYEHTFMLDKSKVTLEIPDSVEKMTLPMTVLTKGPVEVDCTSFTSLTQLHRKFKLSDYVKIASPAVEYSVTGLPTLQDHARITKRFIGSPKDLKVWKFNSDEGIRETIDSIQVPEKTNEEQDIFYEVKGNVVYIYTKSFSGFYCTTCGHRELKLKAFLFGSYKRFQPNRHEVRLMMYIADEVFKFPDYKKLMLEIENREGRVLKTEEDVVLLDDLHEEDRLLASVSVDGNTEQWIHKLHPSKQAPIKPVNKNITLKDIANKCVAPRGCSYCHLRVTDVPYSMQWYLTNSPGINPEHTFKCVVDVTCISKNSNIDNVTGANDEDLGNENRATCIVVDELHLRPEDLPLLEEREDTTALHLLIEYLTHDVEPENRAQINYELVTTYNVCGQTVRENITNLQKKLTNAEIYEAVVCMFQKHKFFVELDQLQAKNLIPQSFFRKPTQRVESGGQDHTSRIYEHHQQASNNKSVAAQAQPSVYNGTSSFALPRPLNNNSQMSPITRQRLDLPTYNCHINNVKGGVMGERSVTETQICRPEFFCRPATSWSLNNPRKVENSESGMPSNPRPEFSQPYLESVQSNRVNIQAHSNIRPELSKTNSSSDQDRSLSEPKDYPIQEVASYEHTHVKENYSALSSDENV